MRTSKGPRYYDSKNGWFATFNGERRRLTTGPKKATEQEAKDKYDAEIAARKVEVAGDRNTVWAVLNAYLVDCEKRVVNGDLADNTLRMRRLVITHFNECHGTLAVRDMRPQHVTDFLADMRQPRLHPRHGNTISWGDGTVRMAKGVLRGVFRWAAEEAGLISRSPFDKHSKRGRAKPRRRRPVESRVAILDAEHELLMEVAGRRTRKDFAHLLTFLRRTGARPAEMYLATAAEWHENKQAFVVKATPESRGRYKLAYLGEDRTVHIPRDLAPLAKELMEARPSGPILLTENGTPWSNITLCARFKSARKVANRLAEKRGSSPIRKAVTAYSYRHAYVTRWVTEGRPLWKLCELLNTSETVIRQRYAHLFEQTDALRADLDDFDKEMAAPPSNTATAPPTSAWEGSAPAPPV